MQVIKGDQGLLRDHNRGLIVNLLRAVGPSSRADIARRTGLAPSALTRLVRELIQEGVVIEVGKSHSHMGRRPTLIAFNPHFATTIGIKVEDVRLLGARVDLDGRIEARAEIPFLKSPTPTAVMRQVVELVNSLRQGRTLGVGLCISGSVDPLNGVDLYSPILGWRNVALQTPLEKMLELSVRVENDVNALTLAERWHGAGAEFRNFVCLTVGEGIGAGVVINGDLYRGTFGGAGEVGHITIDPDGPRCRCGERGCLEVFASDQFLAAEAARLGFPDIPSLEQAARCGLDGARGVFDRMGRYLGIGAKNLVNLLNPEAIVLGGERMDAADLFLPAFEEEVRNHSFPEAAKDLKIVPAALGEDGFLIGAATLVSSEFFRLPTERIET